MALAFYTFLSTTNLKCLIYTRVQFIAVSCNTKGFDQIFCMEEA